MRPFRKGAAVFNIDFTNRLPATLPGVPRNQVVKFNNSWVHIGQGPTVNIFEYLVVYRAMVHKVGGPPAFAAPPPTLPGQLGTPWAANWGLPTGNADLEGQVPDGRGGRYFDGIGVAYIQIDITNGNPGAAINVVVDQIMLNSDGYEDPRIFEANGRYFIHSHRYQPDSFRGVSGPDHRVYTGYAPYRTPFEPDNIDRENRALFVKITELELRGNMPFLGQEFYFGSNVSTEQEKNYGFFMDGDTLCAVYGVAPNDRPFTILRAVRGLGGQAVNQFPRSGRFLVEEFQPNTLTDTDSFLQIQEMYKSLIPGEPVTVFSSSGPLIWNVGLNRWQGVGHVKVKHVLIWNYMEQLSSAAHEVANTTDFAATVTANANAACTALMTDDAFVAAVRAYLVNNLDFVYPYVNNYLGMAPTPEDRDKFISALNRGLIRSSLFRRVAEAYTLPQGHVSPWQNNLLANPRLPTDTRVIFHPSCFYFSFFFELDANNYQLNRFSNAFLVYDPANPHFLQFAANLAPLGPGFVMGFGEDDNRTKFLYLDATEYNDGMAHTAGPTFHPVNFEFVLNNQAEGII